MLIFVIRHSWLSECIYRCEFECNYSTFMAIEVWATAFVESRADHLTHVADVASTDVFEKVEILAVFYMITDCEVASGKCHITLLAFARIEE